MYKRLELHNHTTESDGSLTCQELLSHMQHDLADGFALTDHNTISGHRKIKELLLNQNSTRNAAAAPSFDCIYGMEYTTYYGHILCFHLTEYVPWENINKHHPELLFQAIHAKGALAGIAHPYSYGDPIARGCRFEMTIPDYSYVDFIEIFNDLEPLHEVNEPALLLWEDLVLKGNRLAMTCGMDLHGAWDMAMQFATFIPGSPNGDINQELETAIRTQQTCISKGPVLESAVDQDKGIITFYLVSTNKPGYQKYDDSPYQIVFRTSATQWIETIEETTSVLIPIANLKGEPILLSRLYQKDTELEHLICVSAPVILSANT